MDISTVFVELGQAISDAGTTVYLNPPSAFDFPAVVLRPPTEVRYISTFDGSAEIDMDISVYVGAGDIDSAWSLLYHLLSYAADSIPTFILNHQPVSYRTIELRTATNFLTNGDNAVSADLAITLYTRT